MPGIVGSASLDDIGGDLRDEARGTIPGNRIAGKRGVAPLQTRQSRFDQTMSGLVMLHATLKSIHLLAMFVWLGGMFFTLVCLRPALGVLEPPPLRLRLMNAVLQRFFVAVAWAAALM